jgi:hypothetical protein
MDSRNLQVKRTEFLIADKELVCDSCKRPIPVGYPYAVKRGVSVIENEFVMETTIECLVLCSKNRESIRVVSDSVEGVVEYVPPRRLRIPDCWASMPLVAGEDQKNIRIENARTGRWLATGYVRILEMSGVSGPMGLVECTSAQIVRSAFTRDPGRDDIYGRYQTWTDADGFYCREYFDENRDFHAGHWYLAQDRVKCRPAIEIPKEWTERVR